MNRHSIHCHQKVACFGQSVNRAAPGGRPLPRPCSSVANAQQASLNPLEGIPPAKLEEISDPEANAMLGRLQAVQVSLPEVTLQSTFVGPPPNFKGREGALPVILLHGFDGSCIEYRRIQPLLEEQGVETYSVDLLGNGFCSSGLENDPKADLGPQQRREHLFAFWKSQVGRPVVLVGVSLGGAAAIDFALAHPEAVEKLVLLAPQVMTDGIGPMASLPTPLARLGVKALQSYWLREKAGSMGYVDKERLSTPDSVRVGRVHTFRPGWENATLAFMRSGGYRMSKRVELVQQDTTVVWGVKDDILDPKDAQSFVKLLPHAKLVMLEECGHNIQLEQPERVAEIVVEAMGLPLSESGRVEASAAMSSSN